MKICPSCNKNFDNKVNYCPSDNLALEVDGLIGTTFDNQYTIEARLGKGGMGMVYKASHKLSNEKRAIKILHPNMCENQTSRIRFLREGQGTQRIQHPNVVHIYDLCEATTGEIYMVMEYIKGHTILEELRRCGQFSPNKAFALLSPIIDALGVAHENGVIHRDLKPENIMIISGNTGTPLVKLLDLGIAKIQNASDGVKLTATGEFLGTPFYMSPEQWGHQPSDAIEGKWEVDGRADIYSLGVIFYQLITGKVPFPGPTMLNLLTQHVTVIPSALHEVVPSVPQAFGLAVAKSMAKDRCSRQMTTQELFSELKESLRNLPLNIVHTSSQKTISTVTQKLDKATNLTTLETEKEELSTQDKKSSNKLWARLKSFLLN